MGTRQIIGSLIARGLILTGGATVQTEQETLRMTANGWEHVIQIVRKWAGHEASFPQRYSADPTYPGLFLIDEAESKKWMGNLAIITIRYRTPDYPINTGDSAGVPPDEIIETPANEQAPIVTNPRFSNETYFPSAQKLPYVNGAFAGFTSDSPDVGTDSYYRGTKTVVHIKYYPRLDAGLDITTINDPPDPDSYVRIADPPGYDTGGKALRILSEVNSAGLWWAKKNTYIFSETAISTNVYEAA